jgi:hypothetical protein
MLPANELKESPAVRSNVHPRIMIFRITLFSPLLPISRLFWKRFAWINHRAFGARYCF